MMSEVDNDEDVGSLRCAMTPGSSSTSSIMTREVDQRSGADRWPECGPATDIWHRFPATTTVRQRLLFFGGFGPSPEAFGAATSTSSPAGGSSPTGPAAFHASALPRSGCCGHRPAREPDDLLAPATPHASTGGQRRRHGHACGAVQASTLAPAARLTLVVEARGARRCQQINAAGDGLLAATGTVTPARLPALRTSMLDVAGRAR
jgi:hypothetical protein